MGHVIAHGLAGADGGDEQQVHVGPAKAAHRGLADRHGQRAVERAIGGKPMDLACIVAANPVAALGIHGGAIETAMMLHLAPASVRMAQARHWPSSSQERAARYPLLGNGKSAKMGWAMQDYQRAGAVGNAASATAAMNRLLEDARKLEAERQEELRIAKAAKAKADKEAAARAKMEEARKALAAKLYADRCLAEATLELIAEVSRLNNGGSEQVADASIAQHIDQLQALAKSYGYRIAKPSMLAQVVKL